MSYVIYIKNMVCPRCIKVVRDVLAGLGIGFGEVALGQAVLNEEPDACKLEQLRKALVEDGFELLDDAQSSEVEGIRLAIIAWSRMEGERPSLSDYLQQACLKEYSAISRLFSQMKSMTVERYAVLQRIEYAKELISYGDKSISEISWILGFSSPSHFSNQFRKETGISPKQFREMHSNDRQCIDRI